LAVLVIALGVLVIGLLRRIAPVLDRLEASRGEESSHVREGLDAGGRIGEFEAVTATGQHVVRDLITTSAGRSVVAFIEPGCGHCENIMTELIETPWPGDLLPVYLVLSDSEESRQRRLEASGGTVFYQRDNAVGDAFRTNITPVAFVLEGDGIVSTKLIPQHAEELVAVARSASRVTYARR
jgi:hypothetical protein